MKNDLRESALLAQRLGTTVECDPAEVLTLFDERRGTSHTDIAELRAKLAEMTPGPWESRRADDDGGGIVTEVVAAYEEHILMASEYARPERYVLPQKDTDGIAALRNAAPTLLDELEQLRASSPGLPPGVAAAMEAADAEMERLNDDKSALTLCLNDYQARFVALHDAWRSGDNSAALGALRRHVSADDADGKNAVLRERDDLRAERDALLKAVTAARGVLWMALRYAEGGGSNSIEMHDYMQAAAVFDGVDALLANTDKKGES